MKINHTYMLFAFIILILLIIVGIFVFKALNSQNDVIRSEEHRFKSVILAIELFQSSEDLTRMARSYVSTGNPIYEKNYFEILDIRNGKRPRPQNYAVTYWHLAGVGREPVIAPGETVALQDLMRHEGFTEKELSLLRESQANSDHLVNMEEQAFAALNGLYDDGHGNFTVHRTPDRNYAVQLLFSEEYSNEKAKIMAPIQQFLDVLDQRTKDELSAQQAELQQYIMLALVSVIIVMIVVLIKFSHTFRRILYPIEHLRSQVAEIASGNYAARCNVLSGNEIGELCVSFNSMADTLQTDITERKQIEHQVKERIKELQAFYHLSEITEREGITFEKLHQEFTKILPQSWQYPEICCARIVINDSEYRTNNFKESAWMQSAPIKVYGSVVGRIDIGYLEGRPKEDEGPFLKEERLLINTIAERLGHITERKKAEEALRESRQQFQVLVETLYDWVWEVDSQGCYTYISPQVKNSLGYEPREILGKTPFTLMSPEEAKSVSEKFAVLVKDRKPITELENINIHKDGHLVVLETNGRPFYDANGNFKGYRGTDRDITNRKQAEQALQKSVEEREKLIKELQYALENIKTLQGLIPICANCKKIRDDKGFWNQVEGYITEHTDAQFTHGLCPDCGKKLYGDLYETAKKESEARKKM